MPLDTKLPRKMHYNNKTVQKNTPQSQNFTEKFDTDKKLC